MLSHVPFEGLVAYKLVAYLEKEVYILRFLNFGDFNNPLSIQLLGGYNIIVGREDILPNSFKALNVLFTHFDNF